MNKIKNTLKKIYMFNLLWNICKKIRSQVKTTESIFTNIYNTNGWGGLESVSGTGSDLIQTEVLVIELDSLLSTMNISIILDIPCGDFNWMQKVDFTNIKYIGGDIVKEIVIKNHEKNSKKNISFIHLNLIKDLLPTVDLVISRDCFVHFSFNDISLAIENICKSKSKYILTTTFTEVKNNIDIVTGEWRTINLMEKPFNFPDPILLINENCSEQNGIYSDKSMGLWKIEDITKKVEKTKGRILGSDS